MTGGVLPFPREVPAALYVGTVMHARMKPVPHRFDYKVASLAIDLDRLDDADRMSALFRVDRFGLYSFHQQDHGGLTRTGLRAHVDGLLAAAGLKAARVVLLCYPRVAGYVFNPLSVFYCADADDRLVALIYEVRNTFGDKHCYVAPVRPEEASPAGIRQEEAKRFYVSPFVEMAMRYRFRMLPPGDTVRVRILENDADGPMLAATFAGDFVPLTTASLAKLFAAMPFHTLKVIGGIHFEAARLWFKGIRFYDRPNARAADPALRGRSHAPSPLPRAATDFPAPAAERPR